MTESTPTPSLLAAPSAAETKLTSPTIVQLAGFSVGMIGDRIFRDAPALLLLIFMTNFLAIPPAMAGTAIFVPKLLIIFVDPMVGILSDRLQRRSKQRVLMLIGALLAGLGILLFFHVPRFDQPATQALYMAFIVFLGFTGYSFFSVPYLMIAAEVGVGEVERRKVMSWRVAAMAIGLSISAFAGGFMEAVGGGMRGYSIMSWLYAALCVGTMVATVGAIGSLPFAPRIRQRLGIRDQARIVLNSQRYLRVLLVGFLQKIAEGIGYGSFAYFCIYVVQHSLSAIGLVVFAATVGQVIAQPLWLKASHRYGPATLYTAGMLGWCANILLWLLMKGQSDWWLIPLGLQAGVSCGGFLMVTLSMLSKAMAEDAAEARINCDGVFSGFWLAAEKLAFALGALLVGVLLGAFGFVESVNGQAVTQTRTAIAGIGFVYIGVNIAICLISIVAVRRFARFEVREARAAA